MLLFRQGQVAAASWGWLPRMLWIPYAAVQLEAPLKQTQDVDLRSYR